jgi:rod shape-determining protein MreC
MRAGVWSAGSCELSEIRSDAYSLRGRRLSPPAGAPLSLLVCLFLSLALMVLSRLDLAPARAVRWMLVEAASPVMSLLSGPLDATKRTLRQSGSLFEHVREIEELRSENQRLKAWEWRARELERKLGQLAQLTRAGDETGLDFASGRVFSDGRGPFARSMLVDIGRLRGVEAGHAVVNGDGLVGHVVDVGETAARVLLLHDVRSRIPVRIGPAASRAILAGDGTALPRLAHLPAEARLQDGDEVSTSGHEGTLPRGLRIGVVRVGEEGARVELAVRAGEIEHVSVLFYRPPRVAVPEERRRGSEPPPLGQGVVLPPGRRASIQSRAGEPADTR